MAFQSKLGFANFRQQGMQCAVVALEIEVVSPLNGPPGIRKVLDKNTPLVAISDKLEQVKTSIRAKVEYPFRVIKRQFGRVKVRYRGLLKNTAQLHTLFALSNLWMVLRTLLQEMQG